MHCVPRGSTVYSNLLNHHYGLAAIGGAVNEPRNKVAPQAPILDITQSGRNALAILVAIDGRTAHQSRSPRPISHR